MVGLDTGSHCSAFVVGIVSGRRQGSGCGAEGFHTHISPGGGHREDLQTRKGPG